MSTPTATVQVTLHLHNPDNVTVGVISFLPSHVKAGTLVTFAIRNLDTVFHNFVIDGEQSRFIGPLHGKAILKVKFKKPGVYYASTGSSEHPAYAGVFVAK
jgi:hypothetical protein